MRLAVLKAFLNAFKTLPFFGATCKVVHMQLNGFHLHIILVVAMICIVVYVFYIARDIIAIDREVKTLCARVEHLATVKQGPPQQVPGTHNLPNGQVLQGARQQQMPAMLKPTFAMQAGAPPAAQPRAQPIANTNHVKVAPIAQSKLSTVAEDTDTDTDTDATSDSSDETESIEDITVNKGTTEAKPLVKIEVGDKAVVEEEVDAEIEEIKQMLEPTSESTNDKDTYSNLSWNEIKDLCRKRGIAIKGFNKEQLLAKLKEVVV